MIFFDVIAVDDEQLFDASQDGRFRFRDALREFGSIGFEQGCVIKDMPLQGGAGRIGGAFFHSSSSLMS
jgi:hypothetical protein